MHTYTTKITDKRYLTESMVELRAKKPAEFAFKCGQFVQIMIPKDDKLVPRSYSIASITTDRYLIFCIKLLPDELNGLGTHYVQEINIGDEVTIRGPLGRFIVQLGENPLLFVATGAGIAPIISQIRHELETTKSNRKMYLIFGVRYEKDLFWQEELQKLHDDHDNFTFEMTVSRPEPSWIGLNGRVIVHLPDVPSDTNAYLCGSPAMVQEVRKMLIEKGLDSKQIHFEIF